jgi:hypothetical protein
MKIKNERKCSCFVAGVGTRAKFRWKYVVFHEQIKKI